MSKPRLLITGGSGLLALNWACAMRKKWDVILGVHTSSVQLKNTTSFIVNLENIEKLESQIRAYSPDMIVHTAGLTNVDLCESRPDLSIVSNENIAQNIAAIAQLLNINFIHISTDHLYDGMRNNYTENDIPNPLNQYARSKLAAEKLVLESNSEALILRTNFFCWGHAFRQSNSDWLIANFRAGNQLSLFEDIFFTPILADSLAELAHELSERKAKGVYNLVGEDRISKYEFGLKICKHFALPETLIIKTHSSAIKRVARRPADMSLSTRKVTDYLNKRPGQIDHFISLLKMQEDSGRAAELYTSVSR